MEKVIIHEEAFVMMLTAAAEVYDKETYGYLLGHKKKKNYVIQYAVPHQTTIRKTHEVSTSTKAEKKLIDSINFLKGYNYIGEFHSHPDGTCALSNQDIKDMQQSGAGVSVLVALNTTETYLPWNYNIKTKSLTGSIDETYHVEIKAYICKHPSKKIDKLRIQCDFIKKLNKAVKRRFPSLFS